MLVKCLNCQDKFEARRNGAKFHNSLCRVQYARKTTEGISVTDSVTEKPQNVTLKEVSVTIPQVSVTKPLSVTKDRVSVTGICKRCNWDHTKKNSGLLKECELEAYLRHGAISSYKISGAKYHAFGTGNRFQFEEAR